MGAIGISEQMQEILNEFEGNVDDAIGNALKKTGNQTKARLKEVSPKDHGDYAKGWAVHRDDEKGITIHNAKYPGLTHLLSNGHAIVNKYGQFGRVNGDNHIGIVENEYVAKFEEEIVNQLNKG